MKVLILECRAHALWRCKTYGAALREKVFFFIDVADTLANKTGLVYVGMPHPLAVPAVAWLVREVLPCVAILCSTGNSIIANVLRDLVDDTILGFYRTLSIFLVLFLLVGSGMVSLHATNVEITERGRLLTELANALRRKEGRLNC